MNHKDSILPSWLTTNPKPMSNRNWNIYNNTIHKYTTFLPEPVILEGKAFATIDKCKAIFDSTATVVTTTLNPVVNTIYSNIGLAVFRTATALDSQLQKVPGLKSTKLKEV